MPPVVPILTQIHTLHALRPLLVRSFLILSACLRLNCRMICFLRAELPTIGFQALMNPPVRAICPAHIIRFDTIIRTFGEE